MLARLHGALSRMLSFEPVAKLWPQSRRAAAYGLRTEPCSLSHSPHVGGSLQRPAAARGAVPWTARALEGAEGLSLEAWEPGKGSGGRPRAVFFLHAWETTRSDCNGCIGYSARYYKYRVSELYILNWLIFQFVVRTGKSSQSMV